MSQEKSFWQSTAGTVTAVAAMVTALAGVIPIVMAIRGGNGKPTGTTSPTPTVTESPSEGGSRGEGGAPPPGGTAAPQVIASPAALDFGKVAPNLSSSTQTIQLVNTGQDPVTMDQIRVVGPAATMFTISSEGTCKEGAELAPDAPCDLKVHFAPSGTGSQQATLVVQRTPGDPVQIPLSGTGSLL